MVGGATTGYGQAVTVDGTRDYLYGFPRVWQTVQTGYGDNQSELDAAYSYIGGGNLNLFFNGNLQAVGNKLFVFLDTDSGSGQNRLRGDNDVNLASLLRLGDSGGPNGLTFESGFAADHAFVFNISGSNLYLDYENLPTGTGGLKQYVGSSTVDGGSGTWTIGSGMLGVEAAINNTNTLGVSGGSANGQVPALSNTGLELKIPLGLLGTINQSVKVIAFISSPGGDFLSNQFLPDIGASSSTANLDEPRGQDFSSANHPGTQFFYVQPRSKDRLLASKIGNGSQGLGTGANPVWLVPVEPGTGAQDPANLVQLTNTLSGNVVTNANTNVEGHLSRSTDGQFMSYFGYDAPAGNGSPMASSISRTLAIVGQDLTVSFVTKAGFTGAGSSNARSSTFFDSSLGYVGLANAGSIGAYSVELAGSSRVHSANINIRTLNIFNNRPYYVSGGSAVNGFPILGTTGMTGVSLGLSGLADAQDFAFSDPITLYVARDSATASALTQFRWDGSSWVATTWDAATVGGRLRSITLSKAPDGKTVVTGVTGNTNTMTPNKVVQFSVTEGPTPTISDLVTLTAALPVNYAFGGIDWSPEPWLAPVANNDASSTDDATPINGNVLTNDSGEVKQNATVVSQSGPGSFSLGNDGSYTYTPNGTTGTAVLTYKFDDSDQDSNSATLTVTVSSSNAPPVATGGSYSTNINTPKSITLAGTDPDSDPLTYAVTQLPTHGTLGGTAPN